MSVARRVEPLPMPTGPALESVLPRLAAALAGDGPALLPVSAGDPGAARTAAGLRPGEPLGIDEDDPADPTAFVLATSGSTGRPKGALLNRSALSASAAATHERLGGPGRWLLALPAQHIAGLQVLLRAMATGTSPDVLDTAPPFTSARFVAAVAAMLTPSPGASRRYVSLVPTQLHRILTDEEATAAAACFDAVLVGGAASSPDLLDRARAAGIAVVTTYGMSETCGGCVYDADPLAGVEISTDADGRIELSGPVVARGYRGRPRDPAFQVHDGAHPNRRTFRTDDWGVIEGGRLTVLGRIDDVVITGGVKVPPGVVEARIAAIPGVGQALVVGIPDPVWGQSVTALMTRQGRAPGLDLIREALVDLPAAYRPRHLLWVDDLPTLGIGKPDREAGRRLATESLASQAGDRIPAEPGWSDPPSRPG